MPVIYTWAALRSLATIRAYIGKQNPAAANRVAVQIIAACDRLEYLPERGRPGLKTGTREMDYPDGSGKIKIWPRTSCPDLFRASTRQPQTPMFPMIYTRTHVDGRVKPGQDAKGRHVG